MMDWKDYDPRLFSWLEAKASNLYSQNGEDGILAAIFERIGTENKWCLECGAADGLWFLNSRQFIDQGWSAVLIEGDPAVFEKLQARYAGKKNIKCWNYYVDPVKNTLDKILEASGAPIDLDLMVIDVDGGDYYLFNSLWKYRPRVVVCEYNPDADPMFIPEVGIPGQAGRHAIQFVGDARGYKPVCATRYNVIFVRNDIIDLLAQPIAQDQTGIKVGAAMSTPRLGPLATQDLVFKMCSEVPMSFARGEGVWWHHSLTRCIENHLEAGIDYILTIDFDSIFTSDDARRLICHLYDNPDVDVVTSIQMKREGGEPLITSDGEVTLTDPLIPMKQAHFGLTIFRRSVFERLPKPWFHERPDPSGGWGENRVDADIHFWQQCRDVGLKMMAATDVVIGHMEWVATWPGQDFKPIYQPLNNWRKDGMPTTAFRKPVAAQAASLEMK
jgi:hypothetical protein